MRPRRLLGKIRRAARTLRCLRPVTVRGGVGAGLKMDLRHASAWYGHGTNELPVQDAVGATLRPGDVFFDIGANVGFFSLIAARLVGPRGSVVAFEPVPANAAAIRRNASLNRLTNVHVIEAAVSDDEGVAELRLDRHPGGAVLASPGSRDGRGKEIITVPRVTIDGLVERHEAPVPTLIKIDVEGTEDKVLAGLARTAVRCRPVLICEFDDATPDRVEAKLAPAVQRIESWGYATRRLPDSYGSVGWCVVHIIAEPRG